MPFIPSILKNICARCAALIALVAAATIFLTTPASAHVGSPDVFYEGDAGPYHLFVTVRVPQVIPGVAEVEIRASSGDVREISTAVARLTGAGSKYAPIPDLATRSKTDPNFFTSSLWLMEYGSLRVLINVRGTRGSAEMSVPVPSAARRMLPMPRWLGALLLLLAIGLALGAIAIVGAAARDARLSPGAPATPQSRRSGRRAMAVTAVVVVALFYLGFAWWDADARDYAATTMLFKPPRLTLSLDGANHLTLVPSPLDKAWLKYKVMEQLVPDHGHLMHLFLVRTPALDRLLHLHPDETGAPGAFAIDLPSLEPGHYDVFADVVDKSGFPWTLVGSIDLPQISGAPLSGDNSAGSAQPVGDATSTSQVLADGTRVLWNRGAAPLRANTPMILHFTVQDHNGSLATDLEPYMGMAAHAEIIRSDRSVFAHIHPSGSVPMAALMMASNDAGASGAAPMTGMIMPPGASMADAPATSLSPEISMPYGFPQPGLYRIFLQFKRAGKIETAAFDAQVN